MLRALLYENLVNTVIGQSVPSVVSLFNKIEALLSAKATHHKPKQQEPLTLSEHEFFFDSGSRTLKYVCSGKDRLDAELTALDAMRGSYFKLRKG